MHFFNMSVIPESEEKNVYSTLGGDYSRGVIIQGEATIQGNKIYINCSPGCTELCYVSVMYNHVCECVIRKSWLLSKDLLKESKNIH